jgi:hypothetical protein
MTVDVRSRAPSLLHLYEDENDETMVYDHYDDIYGLSYKCFDRSSIIFLFLFLIDGLLSPLPGATVCLV